MIQRIQSIYLFLVTCLLAASMFLPLGSLVEVSGHTEVFKPLGVMIQGNHQSTWGLFCILTLSAVIALATIFLFKNRILQIRMTVFNSVLLVGFYLAFMAFFFLFKKQNITFQLHWALCLPLICLILNYLAIRAIGRDEAMVHAADRLR